MEPNISKQLWEKVSGKNSLICGAPDLELISSLLLIFEYFRLDNIKTVPK
jgi:hypothetical protein